LKAGAHGSILVGLDDLGARSLWDDPDPDQPARRLGDGDLDHASFAERGGERRTDGSA
jgi:hypothetical protein